MYLINSLCCSGVNIASRCLARRGSFSAGTLSCRKLPVSHYPDATDSDSDQEHLQQAFERYGTTRKIPFS